MKKMVLPGMNKRRWQRRMLQLKKKTALTGLALLLILCLAWHGLAESQPSLLSQQDSPSNQVVQYVVYEAVFFDSNAVDAVFTQVRGDAVPYEIVTRKYHVIPLSGLSKMQEPSMEKKSMSILSGTRQERSWVTTEKSRAVKDSGLNFSPRIKI